MIIFGPVPSRRLGRSLGINNIPPKVCTYSCIYCQLGRTMVLQAKRQVFYNPEDIFQAARSMVEKAREVKEPIDSLTFVPDGEPTLDLNLGNEIGRLKQLGIRVAVITNASLIWDTQVRDDLLEADWVSLKIDSVEEKTWRRINRPQRTLRLADILAGILDFAAVYQGKLVTETMLVPDLTASRDECAKTANFLSRLQPDTAYISIPTRPPAEKWISPPPEAVVNQAFQIFAAEVQVELLTGYEGSAFACVDGVEESLLSITSVHPMRQDALQEFLVKTQSDWTVVDKLIAQGKLIETLYAGKTFYVRKLC